MTRTSAPLKQLVLASMFVAIEVVLNSILVLQFQTMKLSFAFIVIALTASSSHPTGQPVSQPLRIQLA